MGVEVLIFGYSLVCLSMLVFNLMYSTYLRSGEHRSRRRSGRIADTVGPVLEQETLPEGHMARMEGLLSHVRDLLAFDEYLQALPPAQAASYLPRIAPVFPRLADRYIKCDEIQGAYFSHFIAAWGGFLGEARGKLTPKVAQFIRQKSLYSKVNALKALCALGDGKALLDALLWLVRDEDGRLQIHEKVVVEALLTYRGDTHAFITLIWLRFEQFSVPAQRMLLDYIRFQSGDYRDELLGILTDEKRDKELRLSAVRYFGRYPDDRAREVLLQFASDGDPARWEYTAVAASSLAGYPGRDTTGALTAALRNPNWHVRYNSASSLEQLGFTDEDLLGTAAFDDRYAREMLAYRLETRRTDAQPDGTREAPTV